MKQNDKATEVLTLRDAMQNLSAIAELDPDSPASLGIVKKHKIVIQDEDVSYRTVQWLTPGSLLDFMDAVKETYRTILSYLHDLYGDETVDWNNPKTKKGIQSIMAMAGEAANQIDHIASNLENAPKHEKVTNTKEFKTLQDFYVKKLQEKFPDGIEGKEEWGREWEDNEESLVLDTEKSGLKDFETIQKDKEYELFYLRSDEGRPFFNRSLLRNIKLVCDFDESLDVPLEEDPLLRIRSIQDRDYQSRASQILTDLNPYLQDFYSVRIPYELKHFSLELNKVLMALMLSANPRNLIQNTIGKSSIQYFQDFLEFLNQIIHLDVYQKLIAYPPDKDQKAALCLMDLVHHLCREFFITKGGIKGEMIAYIHRLARMGAEKNPIEKPSKNTLLWNQMLIGDENIRNLLKFFPSGPLFKVLDLIRHTEPVPFYPLRQKNLPTHMYNLEYLNKDTEILKIPSPTAQQFISKAEIAEEFKGFLRAASSNEKHLLINLQDRTSWKEHARSHALESLQRQAEFRKILQVVTLTKDTDFYYQTDAYLNVNNAKDFLKLFIEQLTSPEECGFYFPSPLNEKEFATFLNQLIPMVHEYFFDNNKELTRKNRLDFIEIVYQFLVLKIVEIFKPKTMSFSCKDALDTGAAFSAGMFGFIRILSGKSWSKEDIDYLLWLFYSGALSVRERSIDSQRFNRVISFLSVLDNAFSKNRKKLIVAFSKIYELSGLESIGLHCMN